MRVHALQLQMNKRLGKEARFFCLPEELASLIAPILGQSGAQLCVARKTGGLYHFRAAHFPEDLNAVDPQFYVCTPSMIGASGLSSLANIAEVWFAILNDRQLRMSRISMLAMQSDLGEEDRRLQQQIYSEARKALAKTFRRGVLGRNSKTGGEHFYKDIFISDQAARAYRDGVVLTSLLGDGFVTYHVNVG